MPSSNWHQLHFNKIAKVIRDHRESAENISAGNPAFPKARIRLLNELTLEFAEYFASENPRFKPDMFVAACGYDPERGEW